MGEEWVVGGEVRGGDGGATNVTDIDGHFPGGEGSVGGGSGNLESLEGSRWRDG